MLAELKAHAPLLEVAAALCPELPLREGTNDCPFCGRRRKLTVRYDRFRCHHPACGARGDVFDLLVRLGKAPNLSSAVRMVANLKGQTRPTSSLDSIWEHYRQDPSPAADWAASRHLPLAEIGYGHEPDFLRRLGWPSARLQAWGLLSGQRELMAGRVVFPLRDLDGRVIHLQGRALDADTEPRWLSTARSDSPPVDRYWIHPQSIAKAKRENLPLLLAEGATDTLSLVGLGLPAVGTPGVNVSLSRLTRALEGVVGLVAVYDNDVYPLGSPLAGQYKSWLAVIPELVELAVTTNLPIICAPPPSIPGCKDYNDWIRAGVGLESIVNHIRTCPTLEQWILELLPSHPSLLGAALNLLDAGDLKYEESLRCYLSSQDILQLLREVCG